jgi:hypothetical protein
MTTFRPAGAPFPRSASDLGAAGPPPQVAPRSGACAARLGASATPSFAACLDDSAKERCTSRPCGQASAPATRTGVLPHWPDTSSDAKVTSTTRAAQDRADADADEGVLAASDTPAVGCEAPIDPMVPILVSLAARGAPAPAEAAARPDVRAPLDHLMARLVRRIAWSGNARTGSARLEFGAGELEGATLTIHADDGLVRVALELPPGMDHAAWKERISRRLGARGLQVEAVEVA